MDKVRLDQHYNQYQPNNVKHSAESEFRFPLEKDGTGVVYEPSHQKKTETPSSAAGAQTRETGKSAGFQNQAPTLELSTGNQGPTRQIENPDMIDRILDGIQQAIEQVKSFFHDLWYGESGTVDATESVNATTEETIDEVLKSGDMEKLEAFLTEHGSKKPARNSELLTSYNRYGTIVKMDPSDKKRILEGNFHDIEL